MVNIRHVDRHMMYRDPELWMSPLRKLRDVDLKTIYNRSLNYAVETPLFWQAKYKIIYSLDRLIPDVKHFVLESVHDAGGVT